MDQSQIDQAQGGAPRGGSDTPALCVTCARPLEFGVLATTYVGLELSDVSLNQMLDVPIICVHCGTALLAQTCVSSGKSTTRVVRQLTEADLSHMPHDLIRKIARVQTVIYNYIALKN